MPPSVVNDVVLVGRVRAPFVGPGDLIALDKRTGFIIKEWALDSYFQGGIAVVDDSVMFGTGYGDVNGSFNVWKLGV